MAAMIEHRAGDLAHEAEAAAAIDEADARLRQDAAEGARGFDDRPGLARPGAAIDTDALQAGDGLTVIHGTPLDRGGHLVTSLPLRPCKSVTSEQPLDTGGH